MKSSTLVITGTDTGVGKTIITAALVGQLHHQKIRAAGIKPVETGCEYDDDHNLIAADGAILQAVAPWVPANTVAPYRFGPPIAPAIAAQRSGLVLLLKDLVEVIEDARHYADFLVIEGAGGALSPLTEDGNTLDLAQALNAPILIAAKDTLGTQSQTLGVIESAKHRKLDILGVVLNRLDSDAEVKEQANASAISKWGGVQVFDHLGQIEGTPAEQVEGIAQQIKDIGLLQAAVDLTLTA